MRISVCVKAFSSAAVPDLRSTHKTPDDDANQFTEMGALHCGFVPAKRILVALGDHRINCQRFAASACRDRSRIAARYRAYALISSAESLIFNRLAEHFEASHPGSAEGEIFVKSVPPLRSQPRK